MRKSSDLGTNLACFENISYFSRHDVNTYDFFTDLLKWRGKIAAILDRASWNKSGKMKQFLADNKERIDYRYFPVGWPQLNPTEGFWNVLKRNSLMHEHYDNVDERVGRALYFLQNSRINIDGETYIFRDPKPIANLF